MDNYKPVVLKSGLFFIFCLFLGLNSSLGFLSPKNSNLCLYDWGIEAFSWFNHIFGKNPNFTSFINMRFFYTRFLYSLFRNNLDNSRKILESNFQHYSILFN